MHSQNNKYKDPVKLQFIQENAGKLDYDELAERTGWPGWKVARICNSVGFKKRGIPETIKWTRFKENMVKVHYRTDKKYLSKLLGISVTMIYRKAVEFELVESPHVTDEQLQMIKKLKCQFGNPELHKIMKGLFDDYKITAHTGITSLLRRHNIRRTAKELEIIEKRYVEMGVRRKAVLKIWDGRGRKPKGTVYKQKNGFVMIKIGNKKRMSYMKYLWEKSNGPTPKGHFVHLIDPEKPITVDNLEAIPICQNVILHAVNLTDNYLAGKLAPGNPELAAIIKSDFPELIELKRMKIEAQRKFKIRIR